MEIIVGRKLEILIATGARIGHNGAATPRFKGLARFQLTGRRVGTIRPGMQGAELMSELVGHDVHDDKVDIGSAETGHAPGLVLSAGSSRRSYARDAVDTAQGQHVAHIEIDRWNDRRDGGRRQVEDLKTKIGIGEGVGGRVQVYEQVVVLDQLEFKGRFRQEDLVVAVNNGGHGRQHQFDRTALGDGKFAGARHGKVVDAQVDRRFGRFLPRCFRQIEFRSDRVIGDFGRTAGHRGQVEALQIVIGRVVGHVVLRLIEGQRVDIGEAPVGADHGVKALGGIVEVRRQTPVVQAPRRVGFDRRVLGGKAWLQYRRFHQLEGFPTAVGQREVEQQRFLFRLCREFHRRLFQVVAQSRQVERQAAELLRIDVAQRFLGLQ